jgi:hypothetical protein
MRKRKLIRGVAILALIVACTSFLAYTGLHIAFTTPRTSVRARRLIISTRQTRDFYGALLSLTNQLYFAWKFHLTPTLITNTHSRRLLGHFPSLGAHVRLLDVQPNVDSVGLVDIYGDMADMQPQDAIDVAVDNAPVAHALWNDDAVFRRIVSI